MNDIAFLDATAQAELVRTKQVKPIELVDAAIERIERLNPQLNAVITPMYDEARRIANGKVPAGPFTGVPFLLKDLGPMYAGVRQASGSVFLKDWVAPIDSELTRRQKAAGLIHVGKTNTPEFGLVPTTEPRLFGPSRNPWNTEHSTGGSSGGSAAAVASGMVPMAHGNDGGGSIRIPASCCGLFGLKPTRARITHGPMIGDSMSGLTNDHAVTRTVRDSAALLDATQGSMPGDPYVAPEPARPFLQEVGADPGHLRIAFTVQAPTGTPVHADNVAAVHDAAKLLTELGHEVEEAAPEPGDLANLIQSFTVVWSSGNASGIDRWGAAIGKAAEGGVLRAGDLGAVPGRQGRQRWRLPDRGRQPAAAGLRDGQIPRALRHLADADAGLAAAADRLLRLDAGRAAARLPARRRLRPVHADHQRQRPARRIDPALLERGRPAHRHPLRRALRTRPRSSASPRSSKKRAPGPTSARPSARSQTPGQPPVEERALPV